MDKTDTVQFVRSVNKALMMVFIGVVIMMAVILGSIKLAYLMDANDKEAAAAEHNNDLNTSPLSVMMEAARSSKQMPPVGHMGIATTTPMMPVVAKEARSESQQHENLHFGRKEWLPRYFTVVHEIDYDTIYVRDPFTDLCFLASTIESGNGLAFTHVPCEKVMPKSPVAGGAE